MTDASPPFSLESEQSVLGGILLDPEMLSSAQEHITAADFYQKRHHVTFDTIAEMAKRDLPIDIMTLFTELKRTDKIEVAGGAAYVASLPDLVTTAAHVSHHAKAIKGKAQLREIIAVSANISALAYGDPENIDTFLDETASSIFEATQNGTKKGVSDAQAVVKESFSRIQAIKRGRVSGLNTGYHDLDRLTGGLHRGDIVVLAARPGMGKTALALNVAAKLAKNGHPVLFYSLEMSRAALGIRLLCSETRQDSAEINRGNVSDGAESEFFKASQKIQHWPLHIDDSAFQTATSIRATSRRLRMQHGIKLVIVDYLQLMTGRQIRDGKREQEISEISRAMKGMAKELDVPVVVLSQLNREVEKRDNHRPRLSDLRESGAIEQDADIVVFLYRAKGDEATTTISVDVAKQRNGPTGIMSLTFLDNCTRFENYREEPNEPN